MPRRLALSAADAELPGLRTALTRVLKQIYRSTGVDGGLHGLGFRPVAGLYEAFY